MGRSERGTLTGNFNSDLLLELDEFEIWNSWGRDPGRQNGGRWRSDMKNGSMLGGGGGSTKGSKPVKVPEWSKILRGEEMSGRRSSGKQNGLMMMDVEEGDEDRIPPHEVVARRARSRRVASYSVHEGIGRTLKGRDLSRVRNAIWEKIGFQG